MQSSFSLNVAHMGAKAAGFLRSARRGTVLTSHTTGIWCRFTEGETLLVHDADYGSLPFGLASLEGLPPGQVTPGDTVENDPDTNILHCGSMAFAYGQAVTPAAAGTAFSAELVHERTAAARSFLTQNCPDAFAARFMTLEAQAAPGGACAPSGELWEQALYGAVTDLYRFALRPEEASSPDKNAQTRVQALIGLGPGLTPLGDDILCAWLYAAHVLARATANSTALRFVTDLVPPVLELAGSHTTPQSAAFLRAAAEGGHISLFAETLGSLCDPNAPWSGMPFARIVRVGHSSGCGFLLGLLLGTSMSVPVHQK